MRMNQCIIYICSFSINVLKVCANYITSITFIFITSILKCVKTHLVGKLIIYILEPAVFFFIYSTNYNLSMFLSSILAEFQR